MTTTPGGEYASPLQQRLFDILENATGRSYEPYVFAPFEKALRLRIDATGAADTDAYLKRLADDPEEIHRFERRALVGVTRFFRNPGAFETLRHHIEHRLWPNRPDHTPLRVWVPGCSTGGEAFSIAIVIRELNDCLSEQVRARIVGCDINARAIEIARRAQYDRRILSAIRRKRRTFFNITDSVVAPIDSIRRSVWFTTYDLLEGVPFEHVDLISCRNLLIYLRPRFQRQMLSGFCRALGDHGLLFVGLSETVSSVGDDFRLLDGTHRIFMLHGDNSG